ALAAGPIDGEAPPEQSCLATDERIGGSIEPCLAGRRVDHGDLRPAVAENRRDREPLSIIGPCQGFRRAADALHGIADQSGRTRCTGYREQPESVEGGIVRPASECDAPPVGAEDRRAETRTAEQRPELTGLRP